jgi:hypothetical protein
MELISDKARENRARRAAERRGFRLEKSRRRDRLAIGYGKYQLINAASNTVASLGGGWLTLMEVENQLEILSAVQDPSAVRLIQATAALGMAVTPMSGLDWRTMDRLAGPVTAAASLLGEGTADELAAAVHGILAVDGAVAPPDFMKLRPLFDELRAAYGAYEAARGRLARPLTTAVPTGITREFRPRRD